MKSINNLLLKGMLYPIILFMDLPSRLKNWFRVRIFKDHLKYFAYGDLRITRNIAVLVTYPGTSTFGSVSRLANWFEEAGYFLILVINENPLSEMWKSKLINNRRMIIVRPNIGGDFGGYKLALKIISSSRSSIENLVISNDSMLYGPTNKKTIMKLVDVNAKDSCTSLFLNMQTVIHAPSMLLRFGKESLERNEFWNFWKKYYPYSSKRKIIRRGEHELTRILGWRSIHPVFSAKSIRPSTKMTKAELIQLCKWVAHSDEELHFALNSIGGTLDHWFLLNFAFENFHISDAIGAFAARALGAPLKLDLARRGLTTKENLLKTARTLKVNEKETYELELILNAKDSYLSRKLVERLGNTKF